jgi:hypothetical protein
MNNAVFTTEDIIVHQIKRIDESWPYTQGNSQFLVKKLHESRIKFREAALQKTLLDSPYLNASVIMKLPLTYGSLFALLILYEYVKKYNPSSTVSFMLRIANKAVDPNMQKSARTMIRQYLSEGSQV